MRRVLCALLAVSALILSGCCDDCGCRDRHYEGHRSHPHNQIKPTEPWSR